MIWPHVAEVLGACVRVDTPVCDSVQNAGETRRNDMMITANVMNRTRSKEMKCIVFPPQWFYVVPVHDRYLFDLPGWIYWIYVRSKPSVPRSRKARQWQMLDCGAVQCQEFSLVLQVNQIASFVLLFSGFVAHSVKSFRKSAFLNKCFFKAAQLSIQEITRLMNQADCSICGNGCFCRPRTYCTTWKIVTGRAAPSHFSGKGCCQEYRDRMETKQAFAVIETYSGEMTRTGAF